MRSCTPMRELRRASPDEVRELAALHLRAALAGYAHIFPPEAPPPTIGELTEQWRRMFDGGGAVFVAVDGDGDGDQIIGEVVAIDGHLARLYVDPGEWGGGIGAALHDAAIDELRGNGCASASLWVLEANDRARRFYERRGWRPDGRRKATYAPAGIDDVGYSLKL